MKSNGVSRKITPQNISSSLKPRSSFSAKLKSVNSLNSQLQPPEIKIQRISTNQQPDSLSLTRIKMQKTLQKNQKLKQLPQNPKSGISSSESVGIEIQPTKSALEVTRNDLNLEQYQTPPLAVQKPRVKQFKNQSRFIPPVSQKLLPETSCEKTTKTSLLNSDSSTKEIASTNYMTKIQTKNPSICEVDNHNQELLSLLACLNEQAIKEINQPEDIQQVQIGQQRLQKAHKIISESNFVQQQFDNNYKAIISYNLACSYQMQGDLSNCSKYLLQAITNLEEKLKQIKDEQETVTQPTKKQSVSSSGSRRNANSSNSRSGYQIPTQLKDYYDHPIFSPVQSRIKKRQNITEWFSNKTPAPLLQNAIIIMRSLSRFTLQLCAVLSQLNEHEKALQFSKTAATYSRELAFLTRLVILLERTQLKTKYNGNSKERKLKVKSVPKFNYLNRRTPSIKPMKSSVYQSYQKAAVKLDTRVYTEKNLKKQVLKHRKVTPELVKSERESLERIHTFSLKDCNSSSFSETRSRLLSANSSNYSSRSCSKYLPEKVQIFDKQLSGAMVQIQELCRIQQEFQPIQLMSNSKRQEYFRDKLGMKKQLRISFQTYEELDELRNEKKFKIALRSALGIKIPESDDWIQKFNIGNIMHLQPVCFDEFNSKKIADFSHFVQDEISNDKLLYKIIFVIVAYFCIGTELRFLTVLKPQTYTIKDSEIWQAKAIHIACSFLPSDCPLINHIIQSYSKHHLRPKIKRRQEQIANILLPVLSQRPQNKIPCKKLLQKR